MHPLVSLYPSLTEMSSLSQRCIIDCFTQRQDPIQNINLYDGNCIQALHYQDQNLKVVFELPYPCQVEPPRLMTQIKDEIEQLSDVAEVLFDIQFKPPASHQQQKIPSLRHVKHVIMVASGKGGVGKSTTAVNIALALEQEGAKVGLLDADIYGPSMPILCQLVDHDIQVTPENHMKPAMQYGLAVQSIGFLVKPEQAQIWRGPMASQTLLQLIQETSWPELDYLIVDLPPGTGDIQLTLSQKLNLSGAIIVTTPQDLATADAEKGIVMFNRVHVPILGLVENMSYHRCTQCGHEEHIFGKEGGSSIAERYDVPILGYLPLHQSIRESADQGCPIVVKDVYSDLSRTYREIAQKAVAHLTKHSDITNVSIDLTEK